MQLTSIPERARALLGVPMTKGAWAGCALLCSLTFGAIANAAPTTAPLVQQSDITYLGGFRLPDTDPLGTSSFLYAGRGITPYKDPTTGKNTLFMQGHAHREGNAAQIEVPATFSKETSSMPVAKVLQTFGNLTEGKLSTAGDTYNGMPIYGLLAYNSRLIIAVAQSYGSNQVASHGVSGFNIATSGDFQGFFKMASSAGPRAVGGYMTTIPADWQSAFGGPALTGNCCLSIIGATSSGPSATVFNPDDVGRVTPIPGKTVLFYPLTSPLCGGLACETTQNDLFNLTSRVVGVGFPPGSRSVLFFGGHGTGRYCYGTASECSDPELPDNKGPHAQPYRYQIWAYDANDLVAVKNGTKSESAPRPYAIFTLSGLPNVAVNIMGAGYDPANGRLYLATDYGSRPRIDVYQITVSGKAPLVPRAPTEVKAN